jgi:hypothetical protein
MNDYTLDNFTEKTGFRFRVNNKQKARIALTSLTDDQRQQVAQMNLEEAADFFKARNSNNTPLLWIKEVADIASNWTDDQALTREGAFEEFLAGNGLKTLQDKKPDIPDAVFLQPDISLENFQDRVEAAIGTKRRFRMSREQKQRGISHQDAFNETVARIRAANTQESEAV